MAPRVEGEILIRRSVEEVFDVVADERNEPRFNPRMRRAELLTPEPIGAGTRFRAEMGRRAGRTTPMTVELTAHERPRRVASASRVRGVEIRGEITLDPVPEGTRMRWRWELLLPAVLRPFGPLVAAAGRRQERAIWTSLRDLLEGGRPAG